MTRAQLYWICRAEDGVVVRLAKLMDLPPNENHLTEEDLEQMFQILRAADDAAHSTIVDLVRWYKEQRDQKP